MRVSPTIPHSQGILIDDGGRARCELSCYPLGWCRSRTLASILALEMELIGSATSDRVKAAAPAGAFDYQHTAGLRLNSPLHHSSKDAPFHLDVALDEWQMTQAERRTLVTLLSELRPECAIEIGTYNGGSLAVLSTFSEKVYSLDIDASCRERFGRRFPNAEFLTGRSQDTLPPLLERLQAAGAGLGFILIDGDHSRAGVRKDIESVLRFRPARPLYVLMHDSFNPKCRRGILEADWAASPYVHSVELDFVPGILHSGPRWYRELWDGFALALLLPVPRTGALTIRRTHEVQFQALLAHSVHTRSLWRRLRFRTSAWWERRKLHRLPVDSANEQRLFQADPHSLTTGATPTQGR